MGGKVRSELDGSRKVGAELDGRDGDAVRAGVTKRLEDAAPVNHGCVPLTLFRVHAYATKRFNCRHFALGSGGPENYNENSTDEAHLLNLRKSFSQRRWRRLWGSSCTMQTWSLSFRYVCGLGTERTTRATEARKSRCYPAMSPNDCAFLHIGEHRDEMRRQTSANSVKNGGACRSHTHYTCFACN